MKFFDSLVHATGDGLWLGGDRYDASMERLIREMDRAGVTKACLVAIADYVDNDSVLQFTRDYPGRFVPVGSINPGAMTGSADVERALAELASQGFAGLKLHPRLNGYDPLDARCLAAINAAGRHGLVVLLDTLFRQKDLITRHASDVVDFIANSCRETRIVLLHAGGSAMLDMFEMVRMHDHLILDLSFTLMRYAGSSLDDDIRFLCTTLDQRLLIGSDFPEYVPFDALNRFMELTNGLNEEKKENILHRNLEKLFDCG